MEEKRTGAGTHLPNITTRIIIFAIALGYARTVASFNYDYASACTRPYRSGRSDAGGAAPCDLSKQSYCNQPGSTYPWHAVRRFVHENQGLMRRMYGEQRHISVLKAEIENNDIDSDVHQAPAKDGSYSRYLKDRDVLNTKFVYAKRATGRSSEAFTIPHFRPVQTTSSTTTTKPNSVKQSDMNKTVVPITTKLNKDNTKLESDEIKIAAYKTSFFDDELNIQDITKNNLEMNKIEPEMIPLEVAIKQSIESNSVYPNFGMSHKNFSFYSTTSSQIPESSPADTTTSEYETPIETTIPPDDESTSSLSDEEENDGWKPLTGEKVSTLPPNMLYSHSVKEEQNKNDRIDVQTEGESSSTSMNSNTASTTHHEGQLYQDTVQEEVKPIVKLRGVNACPVKEEVVAPFWANNTRGEVLALLNLYPFEQYVHWEKCTNEHKQMFCREGCRCEQQYRLHRLLAYDPSNECRGIFSDWFRFPSCCVCKCYNMPLEFRVTSRSPRTIEPDIDEAVKREMYNHATSDWYTINFDD